MITIPTNNNNNLIIERSSLTITTSHLEANKVQIYHYTPSLTNTMQQEQQHHHTSDLNFHQQTMNNEYKPYAAMNQKLRPYYLNEEDSSMNMTPLENSLLYTQEDDNSFNFATTTNNNNPQQVLLPQQQNNWSERILHDITGILHILSSSGKVLYCSESCIELTGYHPQEFIGKSLTDFLHTDDLDIFTKNFQLAFTTLTRIKVHYRLRRKDNTFILLESIGQPKQDIPDQPPQSFFAIAQPYLSRSNGLLDSFLEVKMENEWLKKRLNDMMMTQGASPVSATDNSIQQQQYQQQLNIQQDYYIPNHGGQSVLSNHNLSNHNSLGNRNHGNRNLGNQNNNSNSHQHDHHQGDYNNNNNNLQYYSQQQQHYSSTFDKSQDLLLDSNHTQNYMNNDTMTSPQQTSLSRRPSSCSSSTMFQINNNNTTSTAAAAADENTNNYWSTTEGGGYSPSVASSSEVNDMMTRYHQQEENMNMVGSSDSNGAGGLATTSSYLSSNNSTTTVNTDIIKKEKWKRRVRGNSYYYETILRDN